MRVVIFVSLAVATLATLSPCFARGGAPSIIDSPGYQRRLQESRQQLQAQPAPARPMVHHKTRHKRHTEVQR